MQRNLVTDHKEIADRYAHRNQTECSSWLTSFQSGYKYCASPAFTVIAKAPVAAVAAPVEAIEEIADLKHLTARGEQLYGEICVACHQADGAGLPGAFPPLAGAGEFYGTPENMSGIIIKGLSGEITVKGSVFNGAMPAQGQLSDYEVAAVATYVRTSFGNADGMVTPEQAASAR